MVKLAAMTGTLLMLAAAVGARQPDPLRPPPATPAPGDRVGSIQMLYDDGEFEAVGSFPDWTARSLGVFEIPAGGPWVLTTLRLFMYGDRDHEILLASVDGLGSDHPPHDLSATGIVFNPGRPDSADIGWLNVDIGAAGLVLNSGRLIAVGADFAEGGEDAIGLDNSCGYEGQCGHYWSYWNGQWIYEASSGYNLGLRLVLTGSTAVERISLSAVKARY